MGNFLQPNWKDGSNEYRFHAIEPYVRDRRVLDVGCVVGLDRPDWVHGKLRSVAKEVVGIDIDPEGVARCRERGFDVHLQDAQSFQLGRTFDVVFAGELIEHLDNFHGFLQSARAHLVEGGLLLLTTPNAFGVSNFVYRLVGPARVNKQHTCWFCETTLAQLLARNGFQAAEVKYLQHQTPWRGRRLLAHTIRRVLPRRLACQDLLVVAQPAGS